MEVLTARHSVRLQRVKHTSAVIEPNSQHEQDLNKFSLHVWPGYLHSLQYALHDVLVYIRMQIQKCFCLDRLSLQKRTSLKCESFHSLL